MSDFFVKLRGLAAEAHSVMRVIRALDLFFTLVYVVTIKTINDEIQRARRTLSLVDSQFRELPKNEAQTITRSGAEYGNGNLVTPTKCKCVSLNRFRDYESTG